MGTVWAIQRFFRNQLVFNREQVSAGAVLETDANKIRLAIFFIMFLKFMIMLLCVCILKVHTLTIPKW